MKPQTRVETVFSFWRVAGSCIAGGALVLASAQAVFAGIAISVAPNYPGTVFVNETGIDVSLTITNNSADDPGNPNVDSQRSVTIDSIHHTPACAVFGFMCPSGSRELNLFQIVGPATGSGGAAGCQGTWTFSSPDSSGEVQFVPPNGAGTLVLGPSAGISSERLCTVVFKVNVLRAPMIDANSSVDGLQTIQLGRGVGHFTNNSSIIGTGGGSDIVTVLSPSLQPPNVQAPAMSAMALAIAGALLFLWGLRRKLTESRDGAGLPLDS
jgi:hypothetical protein